VESPGCNGRGINVEAGGTVYAAKAVADRASEPMISYSRGAVASNIRTCATAMHLGCRCYVATSTT
jgi:hypothetical protein